MGNRYLLIHLVSSRDRTACLHFIGTRLASMWMLGIQTQSARFHAGTWTETRPTLAQSIYISRM